MENKEVKEILKWKMFVFGKDVIVKFKKADGEIVKIPARKGFVFYEEKDVKKIIKILENGKQ